MNEIKEQGTVLQKIQELGYTLSAVNEEISFLKSKLSPAMTDQMINPSSMVGSKNVDTPRVIQSEISNKLDDLIRIAGESKGILSNITRNIEL